MSLLMEALKRAERAKQKVADGEVGPHAAEVVASQPPAATAGVELQLEPLEPNKAGHPEAETGDMPLPAGQYKPAELTLSESAAKLKHDIANMEITLEPDEVAVVSPVRDVKRDRNPSVVSGKVTSAAAILQREQEEKRAAVKQIFTAKQNKKAFRAPFFVTVGLLFVIGGAGAVYVYQVTRPQQVIARTPPPLSAQLAAQISVIPGPVPAATVPPVVLVAGIGKSTEPAALVQLPPPQSSTKDVATQRGEKTAGQSVFPVIPTPKNGMPRTADSAGTQIRITRSNAVPNAAMVTANDAALAGDDTKAAALYRQQLAVDPRDRDALLGLAAALARAGQRESAESLYRRVLELDPKNMYARAELTGLSAQQDPVTAESRLKTLIAAQPNAAFLHFKLGNVMASQSRWAEAQQAYFKAFSSDTENPDYAFNLAISLEQLSQPKLALQYYQRALSLSQNRSANFDKGQAASRIHELSR